MFIIHETQRIETPVRHVTSPYLNLHHLLYWRVTAFVHQPCNNSLRCLKMRPCSAAVQLWRLPFNCRRQLWNEWMCKRDPKQAHISSAKTPPVLHLIPFNGTIFKFNFPSRLIPCVVLLILLIISPFSYLYKNEIQSIDRQAFKGLVSLEQL